VALIIMITDSRPREKEKMMLQNDAKVPGRITGCYRLWSG